MLGWLQGGWLQGGWLREVSCPGSALMLPLFPLESERVMQIGGLLSPLGLDWWPQGPAPD